MKKVLCILLLLFLVCGCETKEEAEKRKKDEMREKINEEISKKELSQEAKDWLVNTKVENAVTILCITTSKKCTDLKKITEEIIKENKVNIYFYNMDEQDETMIETLKTTYKIDNYAGYVPYLFITSKEKLLATHIDQITKEELITLLKQNKFIEQ